MAREGRQFAQGPLIDASPTVARLRDRRFADAGDVRQLSSGEATQRELSIKTGRVESDALITELGWDHEDTSRFGGLSSKWSIRLAAEQPSLWA